MRTLTEFAKLHLLNGALVEFNCMSDIADEQALQRMKSLINLFVEKVGNFVYKTHADNFTSVAAQIITNARPVCPLDLVHPKVLGSKPAHELLPMLLMGFDTASLVWPTKLPLDGTQADIRVIRDAPQFAEFAGLEEFAMATGLDKVLLPSVLTADVDQGRHDGPQGPQLRRRDHHLELQLPPWVSVARRGRWVQCGGRRVARLLRVLVVGVADLLERV